MEFTIKVKMKDRWVPHFLSFLNRLERNGILGHSELVGFYSDGDGDFRPQFEFQGVEFEQVEPHKLNKPDIIDFYDAG